MRSAKCLQSFLSLHAVFLLVSFDNLDQFLEWFFISRDVCVESCHQSQSSLASVVERWQILQVGLHWVVFSRKLTGIFSKSNSVVERSPMKSASSDFWLIVGRVGLHISTAPCVSSPICLAREVLVSRGRLSSNRDSGTSSSERYQVWRFRTVEVEE